MLSRKSLNLILSVFVVASLLLGGTGQALAQTASAPAQINAAAPSSPTDETKVPHYFGPYPNWANSPTSLPDATVTITGTPIAGSTITDATAIATVDGNGAITGITITNPGSGYATANVAISGSGTLAAATATITTSGIVTGIKMDAGGAGYTSPVVTIAAPTAGTTATATAYGGVDNVTITSFGSGYTMPTVDFDMPDAPDGVKAQAHVDFDTVNKVILGVIVDVPGSGYSHAPTVVIRDGTIFDPIITVAGLAAAARSQIINGSSVTPNQIDVQAVTEATATATLSLSSVTVDTFGAGYTVAPLVTIADQTGTGVNAAATASVDAGGVTSINVDVAGSGYITTGGIKKFQDGLPILCIPAAGQTFNDCTNNNLGQHIPVAVPDTTTFPGADYYVIAVVQHREKMSSSLPATGTLLREYVQLETTTNAIFSKHVALANDNLDPAVAPTPILQNGQPVLAVDDPHFLGPIISATKDRPVRIVFYNLLPAGAEGDLFLPVDSTMMGSGMGPMTMAAPADAGTVMDLVRNPACTEYPKSASCFKDNRATLHLHGGTTPWISDGTTQQWITPANESTMWPQGVSVSEVPDMVNVAGVPNCTGAKDGCMTFYYTNQQSARMLFYHDHSWGITRLNVYAGEAAGYLITDDTEKKLISTGVIPGAADTIPLIVQDRTFVPSSAQLADQDPTWDTARWGGEGNLWYHHVYMPAQNPGDPSGMSAYGRWMYGPWFWPPAKDAVYGPITNPYYNPNCDPNVILPDGSSQFCEPALIPGTPNISVGMEQFNDTPLVNGTAYPTTTLQPKTYRFRVLNAANDRFWNLQWYIADPTTGTDSEVALNPAEVAAAQTDPVVFPTALKSMVVNGQTVDLSGPDWIQIGSEGGFLPAPTVVDGQQVTTWITDPTRFDVGNVDLHSLLLAPAERADVIVDFAKFAGKTLILYNDAPAAFPARVPGYDYYTGGPAAATLPGYGPNTRTIMQVKIEATTPAPAYNLTALQNAFKHHADGSGVFEEGQHPIIVGQAAYNSAYGTSFAASGWCNSPTNPAAKCDGFARIQEGAQPTDTFGFNTLLAPTAKMQIPFQPKGIHDEMNSASFDEFGRMTANLGLEAPGATPLLQNIILYPFVNPGTEFIDGTNLPKADVKVTPISSATDGTQIWKITHNGVDTHPIHFHLYDVQVINRVTWDNIIIPTEPSELGWKDTVRISPLEDTIVALRPIVPVVPFELPNSIRTLNPMMPVGDTTMFNNTDAAGNPVTGTDVVSNALVNFGWEYVYHCHILSHEEMDMMRPVTLALPPNKPDGLGFSLNGTGKNARLTVFWNDNSINETSFVVQKTTNGTTWVDVGTSLSPLDVTNTHGTRTFTETTQYVSSNTAQYRVMAMNKVGYGGAFMEMIVSSTSDPSLVILSPSSLKADLVSATRVNLTWTDSATNETGFIVERSINGGTFASLATLPARSNTGSVTYSDLTVTTGNTYTYRVAETYPNNVKSGYATVAITVGAPAAPANVMAIPVRSGNNEKVTVTWADMSNNESSFTIQWSASSAFTSIAGTGTATANTPTFTTGNITRTTWYFRVRANNVLGSSAWVSPALGIAPASVVVLGAPQPLVFANSFTGGLTGWTGAVGNVVPADTAALGGGGGQGLAATIGGGMAPMSTPIAAPSAFVFDQTPSALGIYLANFFFDPNDAVSGNEPVDIFTGLDAARQPIFGVQFKHDAATPDLYQIRAWVKTALEDVYTDWAPLANAEQNIQIDWASDPNAVVNLYVEGTSVATVTADTSLYKLEEVRLGPAWEANDSGATVMTAAASASGMMYFDEFISLGAEAVVPAEITTLFFPILTK